MALGLPFTKCVNEREMPGFWACISRTCPEPCSGCMMEKRQADSGRRQSRQDARLKEQTHV